MLNTSTLTFPSGNVQKKCILKTTTLPRGYKTFIYGFAGAFRNYFRQNDDGTNRQLPVMLIQADLPKQNTVLVQYLS